MIVHQLLSHVWINLQTSHSRTLSLTASLLMQNHIRPLLRRKTAVIMGIVNTTPDSFSDGGQFSHVDSAVQYCLTLVEQGADILDIGGESTRPGAEEVSLQQELDRVIPVIERVRSATDTPISIDTYKPKVMQAAITAGASMVNDINGLREEGAIDVVAKMKVPVCIMHKLGTPKTMQEQPEYDNVVNEVTAFLSSRVNACQNQGIALEDIVVDPGIGFGKTLQHNLQLLNSIRQMRDVLSCEVLIGVSRKSMIDKMLDRQVDQRLAASIGLAVQSVLNGAKIIRVHDVRESFDAIRSVEAVKFS